MTTLVRQKKPVSLLIMAFMWFLLVSDIQAAVSEITILVNGKELYSDVAPEIKNDRVMVPLRAVSEGLGLNVDWIPSSRTVIIFSKDVTGFDTVIYNERAAGTENEDILIYINGKRLLTDTAPEIKYSRTMVPLRAVSEGLGMQVEWLADTSTVLINSSGVLPGGNNNGTNSQEPKNNGDVPVFVPTPPQPVPAGNTVTVSIMGNSVATAEQLRALQKKNNPDAPDLADYYLRIGEEYGVRGDIAFCQAAKETGWWKYGGLVKPEQNNYCGLGATGSAATGEENLNGADPSRVWFVAGSHGAYFATPAAGVEAQIQHLYAYACKEPLPAGKTILDPRYTLVTKGIATYWSDLDGRWAVPGVGYGRSIIEDYYMQSGAAL
ncbi:MAG: glucosaminidase domain-containing protein [Syntrophomonadaceae bacterium]|jgi:hypothetical protein|nr:glucosaminidase domain-containing protein [Syntrophomonadaceae bacterium]